MVGDGCTNMLDTANFRDRRAFTIVELLIVIVVIAILAAISIVAYNGIQQRAEASGIASAMIQAQKTIELVKVETDAYPTTISNCPTPASGTACVNAPSGYTATYEVIPQGVRGSPVTAGTTAQPSYELTIKSSRAVKYVSSAERTGTNEFMQYMDMGPIINQYGLQPYRISFDIKSANVATASTVSVYMQNGSGAKYAFDIGVPVTTSYVRRTITATPVVWQSGLTNSVLAFYGSYSTGNIPSVKNVEITLASQ